VIRPGAGATRFGRGRPCALRGRAVTGAPQAAGIDVRGPDVIVYLRSGGKLRDRLVPDVDQYTRRVEVEGSPSLREILDGIGLPVGLVAFAFDNGKLERLDYRPSDGDVITLQPPVSGG
jgi:molybdopterin converting factor small subunit